jgi:hypothetical protein
MELYLLMFTFNKRAAFIEYEQFEWSLQSRQQYSITVEKYFKQHGSQNGNVSFRSPAGYKVPYQGKLTEKNLKISHF